MGDPCGKTYLRNAANDAWISVAVGSGTGSGGGSVSGDYIPEDGWVEIDDSLTYGSATTFTATGDLTATFQKGTKLKFTQNTTKYFYVVSSVYADPTTTVTITGGDDYSLENAAITTPYYSYVENPAAFPEWFNYTPTTTAQPQLTISSVVIDYAKFSIRGHTVYVNLSSTFTLGGSGNPNVYITLPVEANNTCRWCASGFSNGKTTYAASACGFTNAGTPDYLTIRNYDAGNWGTGAGKYFRVTAIYEME
jgi:hypothetical protein